jgi:hypothetical protein
MKRHSGTGTHFPKESVSVSVESGPKSFIIWRPVTKSLKERFRFSLTYRTSRTQGPLGSGSGSLDAQTRREKRKRGGRFKAKKLQQLSESTFSKREELLKTSNEHN